MKEVSSLEENKTVRPNIYQRIDLLKVVIQLWIIFLILKYRFWKYERYITKLRATLDRIWLTCEQLKGQVREEHETKLRQFEKDYLIDEQGFYDYEKTYFSQKEVLNRYWNKMIDAQFGGSK